MGQSNRAVVKAIAGPHKDHTMVANRRKGNFAGIRRETTILRCYTCFRDGNGDSVNVEQNEIRRDLL